MADISEISVVLRAVIADFQAKMQEAAGGTEAASAQIDAATAKVQASIDEMTAQVTAAMAAQSSAVKAGADSTVAARQAEAQKLEAILAAERARRSKSIDEQIAESARLGEIQSTAYLASEQAQRDMAAAREVNSAATQVSVDAMREEIAANTEDTAATLENAAAHDAATLAMVNSNTTREATVLLDELLQHRYHRMSGSLLNMARYSGLLEKAMSPLGLAIIGVTVAVAGLTAVFIGAEARQKKLDELFQKTGGILGVTKGQYEAMGNEIARVSDVSIGTANDALNAVAATGRYTGEQMQTVATGVASAMELLDIKVGAAVKMFDSLGQDPVRAASKLNAQYHFLTAEVFNHIVALQQAGDTQKAASVAQDALASAMDRRTANVEKNEGILIKAAHSIGHAFSRAWHTVTSLGATSTLAQRIDDLTTKIANAKAKLDAINSGAGHWMGIAGYVPYQRGAGVQAQKDLNDLMVQQAVLLTQSIQKKIDAANKSQHEKTLQEGITAAQALRNQGLTREQERLQAILKLQREIKAAAAAGTLEKGFTYSNGKFGGARYQQSVADINKRYAAPKSGAAGGGNVFDITGQLMKSLAAQQAADNQATTAALQQSQKLALGQIAIAKQAMEHRVAMGQEGLRQQYADLAKFENEKYALERATLQKELGLQGEKPAYYKKIQNELALLKQKHDEAMIGLGNKEQLAIRNQWIKTLDSISRAFDQSIKGIIRGTTTLHNAMRNIFQSILLEFIGMEERKLVKHIATEIAQTSATVVGTTTRTAVEDAANKKSLISTALTVSKKILMQMWAVMAGVYSAIASIPYVGPFLAPVMAIAAGALIASWAGRVASAAGGWAQVPEDQMAMVHKNEMILPAPLAESIRSMTGSSTSSTNHFHIHAMDAGSFRDYLRENSAALAEGMLHAHRNGAFA